MLGISPPIVGEESIFERIQERREKLKERLKHIREKLKHNREKVINEGVIPTIRTKIEEITLKVRERVNPYQNENEQNKENTNTTGHKIPLTKEDETPSEKTELTSENEELQIKPNKLAF